MSRTRIACLATAVLTASLASSASALTFNFAPDDALFANPAALAALNRAANQWSQFIGDGIDVNVQVGAGTLGAGVAATTTQEFYGAPYAGAFRPVLAIDAAGDADDGIIAALPAGTPGNPLTFALPAGATFGGSLVTTKANLKALGQNLDGQQGPLDASVTFNLPGVTFDFDNSDGVAAGAIDFESVAARELGRVLGFQSIAPALAAGLQGEVTPTLLDLYRFNASSVPTDEASFNSASRSLLPGTSEVFADAGGIVVPFELSGDSWLGQLGVMGSPFVAGQAYFVSAADLRALDLIGYDIDMSQVPEPAMAAAMVAGVVVLRRQRAQVL